MTNESAQPPGRPKGTTPIGRVATKPIDDILGGVTLARPTLRDAILMGSLIAATALTVVLGVVDPIGNASYSTRFLVWNLFLAWVPLVAAIAVAKGDRVIAFLAGAVWLLFLPNALYLVTDLVHLGDNATLWRHVLQFAFAAWTGTLLAVVSLRVVHRRVETEAGRAAGWFVVLLAVVGAGAGVAIGRFQRWNSWDLLTRPDAVAHGTLSWFRNPLADGRITGVALAVTVFFAMAYLTVWSLSSPIEGSEHGGVRRRPA